MEVLFLYRGQGRALSAMEEMTRASAGGCLLKLSKMLSRKKEALSRDMLCSVQGNQVVNNIDLMTDEAIGRGYTRERCLDNAARPFGPYTQRKLPTRDAKVVFILYHLDSHKQSPCIISPQGKCWKPNCLKMARHLTKTGICRLIIHERWIIHPRPFDFVAGAERSETGPQLI